MPIEALSEVYRKAMVIFGVKSDDWKAYALDWGTGRLNGVLDESVNRGMHLWLAVLTAANDGTAYAANTSPVFVSLKKNCISLELLTPNERAVRISSRSKSECALNSSSQVMDLVS
jgi:hypothetical protein